MKDIMNQKVGMYWDESRIKIKDEEFQLLSMEINLKYDWEKGSLPKYLTGGRRHCVQQIPKGSCLKTLIPPMTENEYPKLIWEVPEQETEMIHLLIIEDWETYTKEKRAYIGSYRDPDRGSVSHLFYDLTYEHQKEQPVEAEEGL